ncbi:FMN-dependent NADH-azoreductase [Clostridium oryzae]|uniref:FMN dependent NADH:quinone oxidoreductase n=1 Tax=Clostridium oryzae TaxID=1450648 RepID=A0A1V4ICS3_9CLOT|nr:NAD(P)H-dependent oxidoreductase [Clostridium oryzae]OPJ57733.1 FMN-dependent NADH-azoreductase 1 [Clostridium oryzae]
MSKVLYIKADAKTDNESRTFQISNSFINSYKELHPDDEIITLDLYKEGINFLPQGKLIELHTPKPGEGKNHPILKYAYQFAEADKYVIAEPFWNLSIPAILKAYIDYVCVSGITFQYTAEGPVGLCTGKAAINITTRGGEYHSSSASVYEMGDKYLRTILGFLGIRDLMTICAEGLDIIGNDVDALVGNAIKSAKEISKNF